MLANIFKRFKIKNENKKTKELKDYNDIIYFSFDLKNPDDVLASQELISLAIQKQLYFATIIAMENNEMNRTRTKTNNAIDYEQLAKVVQVTVQPMLDKLENKFEQRFNNLETKVSNIENRLEKIEDDVSDLKQKVSNIENRLEKIEDDVSDLKQKVSSIDTRLSIIEQEATNHGWDLTPNK